LLKIHAFLGRPQKRIRVRRRKKIFELPSMKKAEIMDGSYNSRVPSMKTADFMDAASIFM
jgi:hypothetical protein